MAANIHRTVHNHTLANVLAVPQLLDAWKTGLDSAIKDKKEYGGLVYETAAGAGKSVPLVLRINFTFCSK
ncbi:hypothetical protein SCHPADRAFT_911587 [Schizopora paradoxa]|uniref:Uncharacterized protein n=1 Tax=Schizopora paradoxa TaxID=27342 RepID=A0A0H2QZX6_9AGAM|nr:hypothetical protein SCHPADRAFT_911587 [Schizopora paradoxa]